MKKLTFDELLKSYLDFKYLRLRPTTFDNFQYPIRKRIVPYFSGKKVSDITPLDIMQWQSGLLSADLSISYINKVTKYLRDILSFGTKYYKVPITIVEAITLLPEHQTKHPIWTFDEFELVRDHIPDFIDRLKLELLYYTGMRKGELFALTFSDIDFDKSTVSITKSHARLKGESLILPTKTGNSRTISIPTFMTNKLKDLMIRSQSNKNDFIFIWNKASLENAIRSACLKTNIPRIRIHDIRHSHASFLIANNADISLVSYRLGHSNKSTTLDVYTHLYPHNEDPIIHLFNQMNCHIE